MSAKKLLKLSYLGVLLVSVSINAISQVAIKIPITVEDTAGWSETVYFGVYSNATACIDTELGEEEIWWQACGMLPHCIAFVNHNSNETCLGAGVTTDLRRFHHATQHDTFCLKYVGAYPVVLKWAPTVGNYFDHLVLANKKDTNTAFVKIDMRSTSSLVMTDSLHYPVLYVLTFSPHGVVAVEDGLDNSIHEFSVSQNYPNPFNPATNFGFRIAERGFVSLKIYNVLGEEIATIINEMLTPGVYTKSWNAEGFPSGLYYYKVSSNNSFSINKMVYMK